jgi:hypothetical protein
VKLASIDAIVRALIEANVPFIVVGGLAVVAHGYGRMTHDLDLVIRLDAEAIRGAFQALQSLGYRPRVPVTADQFADARQRQRWIEEKGMSVLNFHSDAHSDTPVDVFVSEPFDFNEERRLAVMHELAPGTSVPILRLASLLQLKERAGRPQDLADIAELRMINSRRPDER